jgi:thiamine pyridinylase
MAALAALLAAHAGHAASSRRLLHVSLYPYIPEAPAAALTLKQEFERDHPDVIVDMTLNRRYYSQKPADKGVLYEDADVHEIDVVFLRDFLDRHKLAPISQQLAQRLPKLTGLALQAATADGTLVAVPQWLCSDFLIYRADITALGGAHTLADMEHALPPDRGLLIDMKGTGALGELYFSALLARDGSPQEALRHVTATPDPDILDRLRRVLALEPAGFGRNAAYGVREDFYARQFARRAGGAFVGYSEMTHEVLDETAVSCRQEEHCVTASDIRVTAFPFQDGHVHPAVWVDMFGIDTRVHGQTLNDAEAFIAYAVSLPAYRALLIPQAGDYPRYLLPATEAAFSDPDIMRAAPLYPKFRAIIDRGVVVTLPHLNATLHDVAMRIDADLPAAH